MNRNKWACLACVLVIIGLFAGCAASVSDPASGDAAINETPIEDMGLYDETPAEPASAVEETPPEAEEASADSSGGDLGSIEGDILLNTDRKLTYTINVSIRTKEFAKDYAAIKRALEQADGYVQSEETSSDVSEYGDLRSSYLYLRVPVDRYDSFVDTISSVGELYNKSVSTDDVSNQYFDTEARIEILEERKARLMDHLRAADDMEDIIVLERELSDVLYELDQYKGTQRQLDNLVDYAIVSIDLHEVSLAENIPSSSYTLKTRASDAFSLSIAGVLEFLDSFAVGLAAAAPILALIAIALVAVYLVVRLVKHLQTKRIQRLGGDKEAQDAEQEDMPDAKQDQADNSKHKDKDK